jgi:pyruvate dehydrogenase E2 component (dihydrolipoamide acetyltransferase)
VSISDPPTDQKPDRRLIPHSNIRKVVARRLQESKSTIPHFYLSMSCDVTKLVGLRASLEMQPRPSFNDFVVAATSRALANDSPMNAWWQDDGIVRHTHVNLSIAIGSKRGLYTPVLRSVEMMTLDQIAAATKEMTARANGSGFKAGDLEGGTFTISNLGMYGVSRFAAIINPPQVGILAVGQAEKTYCQPDREAVVVELTLSVDHRAVDGVLAAQFLREVKRQLEEPDAILSGTTDVI